MTPYTGLADATPTRTATIAAVQQITAWLQKSAGPLSFLVRGLGLAAGVLGVWRLGNDPGWTQQFFIASGVWSHWQMWFFAAALLYAAANLIQRAAHRVEA